MKALVALACGTALAYAGTVAPAVAQTPAGLDKLSHILVLYLENRSFDNLFGEFPGASGLANAGETAIQRDRDGQPYEMLPNVEKPFNVAKNPPELRDIPALDNLPNKPFAIDDVRPGVTSAERDGTSVFLCPVVELDCTRVAFSETDVRLAE